MNVFVHLRESLTEVFFFAVNSLVHSVIASRCWVGSCMFHLFDGLEILYFIRFINSDLDRFKKSFNWSVH